MLGDAVTVTVSLRMDIGGRSQLAAAADLMTVTYFVDISVL